MHIAPLENERTTAWTAAVAYVAAVTLSAAFLWLRWWRPEVFGEGNWFIQSYAAIALAAAFGGLGPGLVATLLSAAGVLFLFIPPLLSFDLTREIAAPLLTFTAIGTLISALNERLRRSTRRAAKAEHRYRQLIDITPVAMFVSAAGRIVYANESMCRLMNASNLDGHSPISFVREDFRESVQSRVASLRKGELSLAPPMEQVWVRMDGTTVIVESTALVVPWGQKQAIQVVLRDITEARTLADERERLLRASEAANAAKDDFLASLSHELRTPINAIVGWAQILKQRLPGVDPGHALDVIQRNAETQARLVNELLDLSQVTMGSLQVSRDLLDLREPLAAAIEALSPMALSAGVAIEETTPAEPVRVVGDTGRLQQVAWNLLTNAIKFSNPDGLVRVILRAEGDRAFLSVSDDGAGISAEFLPHIFERFRHEDASVSRATPGLGVGLAIVRHIVETHRGTIEAHSGGRGRGAMFVVSLPLAATGERQ